MEEDSYMVQRALDKYIDSDKFRDKVVKHTQRTMRDGFMLITKILTPFLALIISMVVYMFVTLNGAVVKLSESVSALDRAVVRLEERTRDD